MTNRQPKAMRFLEGLGQGIQQGAAAAKAQQQELARLRNENAALKAELARRSPTSNQGAGQDHGSELLQQRALEAGIERIIVEATEFLLVVSPYVKFATALHVALQSNRARGVNSALLCRDGHPKDPETARLAQKLFQRVVQIPHLHAKCYVNQDRAIVASLNLYEFSSQNLELGVSFSRGHAMYQQLVKAVSDYASIGQVAGAPNSALAYEAPFTPMRTRPETSVRNPRHLASSTQSAFCIRCATSISNNPSKPLCPSCYRKWAEFQNPAYPEKTCHVCGEARSGISVARPQCRSCYRAGT